MLTKLLEKYYDCFTEGISTGRVQTGQCEINLIDPHQIIQQR